jgi:hypothetical protein
VWKYLPKWKSEFLWLKNSEGGMICEVCKKIYEEIENFVTYLIGQKNLRHFTINNLIFDLLCLTPVLVVEVAGVPGENHRP